MTEGRRAVEYRRTRRSHPRNCSLPKHHPTFASLATVQTRSLRLSMDIYRVGGAGEHVYSGIACIFDYLKAQGSDLREVTCVLIHISSQLWPGCVRCVHATVGLYSCVMARVRRTVEAQWFRCASARNAAVGLLQQMFRTSYRQLECECSVQDNNALRQHT